MELVVVILWALVIVAWHWERHGWSKERRELLQRIQDPKVAVQQFAQRPERKPAMAVPVDDDAAFAAAREKRLNANAD